MEENPNPIAKTSQLELEKFLWCEFNSFGLLLMRRPPGPHLRCAAVQDLAKHLRRETVDIDQMIKCHPECMLSSDQQAQCRKVAFEKRSLGWQCHEDPGNAESR